MTRLILFYTYGGLLVMTAGGLVLWLVAPAWCAPAVVVSLAVSRLWP